ncbi:MAG: glycoside hydrolase family 13 protein, partial [Clostridia bacterium]
INLQWGSIPNSKSFAGGDLQGIINNLDYLASLNINAIYLTPINNSISNHKYDIIDYYAIDKQFGDNETLTNLVNEAHKRNMRIVLDAVFNHCSDHNALFQDVVNKGKASPYFNWFIIDGEEVSEDNYATFGNCKYMPKFNTSNIEVQRYLIDVARYYIAKFDVDGFRLDVSDEVSHDFWREFRRHIKRVKSDCVIIGENWHNAVSYLRGDQYDSIMNYAYTKACLDYFINGVFSAKDMSEKLSALLMRNTNQTNQMMLNLLDSHDTHRFVTQAKSNINKLMSALTLTYMFIGVPCIYYGTENAMEGDYDPDCRRCMDWTKAHTETHLKSLIRTLGSLRQSGLLAGHNITFDSVQGLLKVERICSNTKLTYYTNMTKNSIFIKVSDVIESSLYSDNLLQSGGFILSK